MNTAELDRLFQQVARKIVSVEITDGPGPLPHGVFEQAPRVIARLDDGSRAELFCFFAHERSFSPAEFVGLSVEEGRRLKFAPAIPLASTKAFGRDDRRPSEPSVVDLSDSARYAADRDAYRAVLMMASSMTGHAVAEIVRSVIVERGLPFDLLTVAASPSGWEMQLRHHARDILLVTVPDGRPVAIRVAIQGRLEAEL